MKKLELSNEDRDLIKFSFGPQLKHENSIGIQIGNNKNLATLCYCQVGKNPTNPNQEIIGLVPGFGSGWTGMTMLAYYLAKLGHSVCMISLPGYGNSPSPGQFYYFPIWEFHWPAETLAAFAEKIFPNKKIHWVGYSMGSVIITRLAQKHPELVRSLTLLNPVGFRERNSFDLALRFAYSGLRHQIAFNGNEIWPELSKYLPEQKSPFIKERRAQRISEVRSLCEGHGMKYLQAIDPGLPVTYVTSKYDSVEIGCREAYEAYNQFKITHPGIRWCNISRLFHNTTMYGSDKAAYIIDRFIRTNKRKS